MIRAHLKEQRHKELYDKAEKLRECSGNGPLTTEGVFIYGTLQRGSIGVVAADHMWGLSLYEQAVMIVRLPSARKQGLVPGVNINDALVDIASDEIDRLMVLERLADV